MASSANPDLHIDSSRCWVNATGAHRRWPTRSSSKPCGVHSVNLSERSEEAWAGLRQIFITTNARTRSIRAGSEQIFHRSQQDLDNIQPKSEQDPQDASRRFHCLFRRID